MWNQKPHQKGASPMIVFDIETGPLPDDILRDRADPFVPPPHPGEFLESSVKVGNLKDALKIQAKIDEARERHSLAVSKYEADVESAKAAWWSDVVSRAALSPLTGQVLAVGYLSTDTGRVILDVVDAAGNDEFSILGRFWGQYTKSRASNRRMVGHNIAGFDIPFLMRRTWMLSGDVPPAVLDKGKWLDSTFVDTMSLWGCGNRDAVKLDTLARSFGVGGKPEGVTGAMFAELLESDRRKAEEYLENDLRMTAAVAERMGVM